MVFSNYWVRQFPFCFSPFVPVPENFLGTWHRLFWWARYPSCHSTTSIKVL